MSKINPSLLIATTSLAVILGLRWSEHAILLALILSSIPFAVVIACYYSHRQSSHFRTALFLGIGLILGSCLGLRVVIQGRGTYAGLPLHRVSSLQGFMREDSRGTETGQICTGSISSQLDPITGPYRRPGVKLYCSTDRIVGFIPVRWFGCGQK